MPHTTQPATTSAAVPVLETKLYIPKPPAGLVTRGSLVGRLRAGAEHRLTVVSAPAGSGKTTLLAEWLNERSADTPAAGWLSLDAADNDPALFWSGIIRALQKIDNAIGHAAIAALADGTAPTTALLAALLNDIASATSGVVLVLDDYHVIGNPAIHTALAFFVDHLPPSMHLLIASRTAPLLPIARLRARGEVLELGAADLRFTHDETALFFSRTSSLALSAADVAALEQRTEGWIAGLKLAALSLRGHGDASAFIQSFSGDNRYIADFLVEEVLHAQPEHIRSFLTATSILDRMSAPLCNALTGEANAQAVLEQLEKSNLFVIALDDRREWYRYHHLFAEVLQAHAARADAAHVRELHGRASRWYEAQGSLHDAVEHALRGTDLDRAATLLERQPANMDRTYHAARWLARVKSLPESVVRARPRLHLSYAWALLNAGELEAAERELNSVVAADEWQREIATARLYLAQSRGDFAGTIEHAEHVLTLTPTDDHDARGTAAALLALAQWADGRLDDAHDTFLRALDSMRTAGHPLDAIRGMFVPADIRVAQGRLRDAARAYEAGLAAAAATDSNDADADELYLGLSEVHYERGELAEAERLLRELEERGTRAGHSGNRHRRLAGWARLAAARGDFDAAGRLLDDAAAAYRRDPVPLTRPFAAMRARIALRHGRTDDAARWARESVVSSSDALGFLREYEHFTLARLLIAQQAHGEAVGLLERMHEAALAARRAGSVVEARALLGLAQHALGNRIAAMDAITSALELAEPEGFLRVFVDEGLPMRDLLRLAAARGVAGGYALHVLAAFDGAAEATGSESGTTSQVLTARELEILRLIAAGMRNQEIAAQLFISTPTVKRHIANIYLKLDASHRTDALQRAATLNLI